MDFPVFVTLLTNTQVCSQVAEQDGHPFNAGKVTAIAFHEVSFKKKVYLTLDPLRFRFHGKQHTTTVRGFELFSIKPFAIVDVCILKHLLIFN